MTHICRFLAALAVTPVFLSMIAPDVCFGRELLFSNRFTTGQIKTMRTDLMTDLGLVDNDAELRSLMGIENLDHTNLTRWIQERVGYMVSELDGDLENLISLQSHYEYQNPGLFPDVDYSFFLPADWELDHLLHGTDAKSPPKLSGFLQSLSLANSGWFFYLIGKTRGLLVGYELESPEGRLVIPVTSPRTGILTVRPRYFEEMANGKNPNALSNTLLRLDTLIHEARHSDGSGKSLGFAHVLCPAEHPYHGFFACDNNRNGPYTIDSLWLRQALLTCKTNGTCNTAEQERLSLYIVDSALRSISDDVWDDKPEGTLY